MNKMFELDYETRSFKPTIEWMSKRYDEANQKLFNGVLGKCKFDLFTSGSGSLGGTNGRFQLTGGGLKYDIYRRIYVVLLDNMKLYVNHDNFYSLTLPKISLNGNKSGSEWAFMVTLVHEMCHYYTYFVNCKVPTKSHGDDFMHIANVVTNLSNGQIEITEKATLERMQHFALDGKAKEINDRKKSRTIILVTYKKNKIKLFITTIEKLIDEYVQREIKDKDTIKIYRSNDPKLIDFLQDNTYRTVLRTINRYWNITNKPNILNAIDNSKGEVLYNSSNIDDNRLTMRNSTQTLSVKPTQQTLVSPKIIFSIKTSNGVFETECNSFAELRVQLQNRFPKMSYETISKLMANRANFKKLEEEKMNIKTIIESVIDEFMRNEFKGADNDNVGTIDPNMNLSEISPIEIR